MTKIIQTIETEDETIIEDNIEMGPHEINALQKQSLPLKDEEIMNGVFAVIPDGDDKIYYSFQSINNEC